MAFFHNYNFYEYIKVGEIMLRKMMYRKIIVSSSLLLVILMMYFIPSNKDDAINPNQTLEYVYPNDLEAIYLLDSNDYLSRTTISASNTDLIAKSTSSIYAKNSSSNKPKSITAFLILPCISAGSLAYSKLSAPLSKPLPKICTVPFLISSATSV